MRSTRTIVFGCALIAAALVFWGVLRAISQSNNAQTGTAVTTIAQNGTPGPAQNVAANTGAGIAYAVTDIPAGAIITREMLALKPSQGKPATGFVTDLDSQAIGFITRRPIPAKSEIRPDEDFIGHISQVGIAGALAPGTRALVLPVPGKATLHDLVKIGNSVDVLASFDGQEARVIAQNMRVLAVDVFANDFPQVNAAMRGPYKADPLGVGIAAPGSGAAPVPGAAPAGAAPGETPAPTPAPANAPPLEPSLTLEVTPQQAAAIQLALASQAPIDFLVRPALPAGRSSEVTLVSDTGEGTANANADGLNGTLATSITKRQIAPYAEAIKNAGKNTGRASNSGNAGNTGTRTASANSRPARPGRGGGGSMMPDFPPPTITTSTSSGGIAPMPIAPAFPSDGGGSNSNAGGGSSRPLAPQPPASYQIPIYADGGIVRTETVPLPTPRP